MSENSKLVGGPESLVGPLCFHVSDRGTSFWASGIAVPSMQFGGVML